MSCRSITHIQFTNTKYTHTQLRVLLSPAQADAALRMAEMGWFFRRVQAFAERGTTTTTSSAVTGTKKAAGGLPPPPQLGVGGRSRVGGVGSYASQYHHHQQQPPPLGLVEQALCFVLQVRGEDPPPAPQKTIPLRGPSPTTIPNPTTENLQQQDELTEYYRLIAVLESQLAGQQPPLAAGNTSGVSASASFLSTTTTTTTTAAVAAAAGAVGGALTLRRLAVWVEEPLSRLRLLATLCDRYTPGSVGAVRCFAARCDILTSPPTPNTFKPKSQAWNTSVAGRSPQSSSRTGSRVTRRAGGWCGGFWGGSVSRCLRWSDGALVVDKMRLDGVMY